MKEKNQNLREMNMKVKKFTQKRKSQKDIKNDNVELKVKQHNKNELPITEKPKNILPSCPSCRQNSWIEFDRG